ncbi:MAG: hypothetical protein JEY82_19200 [Maridesulfovibrio ferrireducens]|nr:hypothetical protein [Maridesulfovibrio ferrireducens]
MRNLLMLVLCLLMFCFAGCSGDVEIVKSGTLEGRPTLAIGQAFDSAFDTPLWSESNGERGEKMVTFEGKISNKLHERGAEMTFLYSVIAEAEALSKGNPFVFVGFETQVEEFFGGRSKYNRVLKKFKKAGADENTAKYAARYLAYSLAEWPVGEPVSVNWVMHADGKHFDFTQFQSDALAGKSIDILVDTIYGTGFVPQNQLQQEVLSQANSLLADVKTAVAVQTSLSKQNKIVENNTQNLKLLSISTDKVDELAASYLSPAKKENIIDNWVILGRLPDQYGSSVTRLVTDDVLETGSRFSRDFLFLDFDERNKSVPSINIAVGIAASLEEAIQAYSGVKMFDVLVDGQKKGRIKMIGRPTPSEGYMYLEYSECPAISIIFKAMISGKRIEFISSNDTFSFDLKGLSSAADKIQHL